MFSSNIKRITLFCCYCLCFEIGFHTIAQAGLELRAILLPHPPKGWDHRKLDLFFIAQLVTSKNLPYLLSGETSAIGLLYNVGTVKGYGNFQRWNNSFVLWNEDATLRQRSIMLTTGRIVMVNPINRTKFRITMDTHFWVGLRGCLWKVKLRKTHSEFR